MKAVAADLAASCQGSRSSWQFGKGMLLNPRCCLLYFPQHLSLLMYHSTGMWSPRSSDCLYPLPSSALLVWALGVRGVSPRTVSLSAVRSVRLISHDSQLCPNSTFMSALLCKVENYPERKWHKNFFHFHSNISLSVVGQEDPDSTEPAEETQRPLP